MLLRLRVSSEFRFTDLIGIQMDRVHALPVSRRAFPSQRVTLPGHLIERCAAIENLLVKVCVTLGRRHEADRAVTMFVVIPAY